MAKLIIHGCVYMLFEFQKIFMSFRVVGEDWNMAKKKKVVEKKVVVPDNPEYNTITTAIKESILAGEPEVHLKKSRKKI